MMRFFWAGETRAKISTCSTIAPKASSLIDSTSAPRTTRSVRTPTRSQFARVKRELARLNARDVQESSDELIQAAGALVDDVEGPGGELHVQHSLSAKLPEEELGVPSQAGHRGLELMRRDA